MQSVLSAQNAVKLVIPLGLISWTSIYAIFDNKVIKLTIDFRTFQSASIFPTNNCINILKEIHFDFSVRTFIRS